MALAGLQVADWLGEDVRGVAASEEQSILFTDLGGFSQWALDAGDDEVADLLRNADAVITEAIETHDGVVIKRLGDGAMAIFADSDPAVDAAFDAIAAVRRVPSDGYSPVLRAGLHVGRPQRIGNDYVGVDVNIAARLCEAAPDGGVLISEDVRNRIDHGKLDARRAERDLRGVPSDIAVHEVEPAGDQSRSGGAIR
jgi:class 3 adenylate cyclase